MEKPKYAVEMLLDDKVKQTAKFFRKEGAELFIKQRKDGPYKMRLVKL